MKPIKCDNCQKFYDGDKYEICPHCKGESSHKGAMGGAPKNVSADSPSKEKSKSKWGLHSSLKKDKTKKEREEISLTTESRMPASLRTGSPEGIMPRSQNLTPTESEAPVSHSFMRSVQVNPMNEDDNVEDIYSEGFTSAPEPEPPENIFKDIYSDSSALVGESHVQESAHVYEEDKPDTSLAAAVKSAGSAIQPNNDKTVAYYNFSNDIEPVVGWLICVEGEYKGESFSLKAGRNNIGRSLSMDIALAKEKSVSRERHAAVTFEPHQKKFYLQSGESSGLTYINDEILMTFKELENYDTVTLGESKFVFLALVGDRFSWDNY